MIVLAALSSVAIVMLVAVAVHCMPRRCSECGQRLNRVELKDRPVHWWCGNRDCKRYEFRGNPLRFKKR